MIKGATRPAGRYPRTVKRILHGRWIPALLVALFASACGGAKPRGEPPRPPSAAPMPLAALPWDFPSGVRVDVTVDASRTIAPVTPLHFGNNVSWWVNRKWFASGDIADKARQAGIRSWRWPGGSSADNYHWDGSYGDHAADHEGTPTSTMLGDWTLTNADFVELCRKTGSIGIVTANYGAARYWDVGRAADLVSRWVRYFNVDQRLGIKHWEIGNEVYGGWEEGNEVPGKPRLDGEIYGKDFRVIARAMKNVDPTILVGAPAVAFDGGDEWLGQRFWMRDLLPEIADVADFLALHLYPVGPPGGPEGGRTVSNEEILRSVSEVADQKRSVDAMATRYAHRTWPIFMTEFSISSVAVLQTIRLVSGLFTAETIGEAIRAGYVGASFWDWNNGLDRAHGGDHGTLAIGDPGVPDTTPRPSYYAFALYARAFGDTMVQSTSSDAKVKVYASRLGRGETGIVVVNEKPQPVSLRVEVSGHSLKGIARGFVLDGADLDAKTVRWNGHAGPSGGGGPFPIDAIPPYGLNFDPAAPVTINLPANCASAVVIE
jgi:hypothetical protein